MDFAPPSNGTHSNVGSSRQLANYSEHEDLERVEKSIYIEGFFNLTNDNICESKIIRDIDINVGQLLKTDAKFYAIHISPSKRGLQAMGSTGHKQAESMKQYIREVFIPKYVKNFNKELSAPDIGFYGRIHFSRNRSDNEQNMHCHLIVSRKDQANKKKLSLLTDHRGTRNGVTKGGFNRMNLFQQAEEGSDKLFGYERRQLESFGYQNIMKNGDIIDQLKLQRRELQSSERKIKVNRDNNQEDLLFISLENKETNNQIVYRGNGSDRL